MPTLPPLRLFGPVSVTSFLLLAPFAAAQSATPVIGAGGAFTVSGTVVSAKTGAPLAQARIALLSTKNRRESIALATQQDGRFAFADIPAGKYSLEGARRGYLPAAYQQHEQFSTAIVTGAGFDTTNLVLRLMPMASLSGKVLDEFGEGVRNAQVRLYVESHDRGSARVNLSGGTMTDDLGIFEFAAIGPGKYYVSATATPWYAVSVSSSSSTDSGSPSNNLDPSLDVAYPTTFSGGSTESASAEVISISGGEQEQIDIHLRPAPSLHLFFHAPGDGTRGYSIPVLQKRVFDSLEYIPVSSTQNGSSPGIVEISGIPAGRYSVRMPGDSGKLHQGTEANLSADHQDLDQLKGNPVSTVKLSVKMPNDEPLPKKMNLGLLDIDNKSVGFKQLDPSGEVSFDDLSSGKYSVRAFDFNRAYSVVRMTSGATQVSDATFSLAAGLSQDWTVFLAAGKTRIEGFVKRSGKPASGIMVVLIPKDPETHQDMFRRDQSDLDGSFVLPQVTPGSYTVVAIDDAWGFDWSKPTLLSHYAEHGSSLTIGNLIQGAIHIPDPIEVQPR